MRQYNVSEAMVVETIKSPDIEMLSYSNRRIAQKSLDGYVLRVLYEKENQNKIVITVYKARRERYEI